MNCTHCGKAIYEHHPAVVGEGGRTFHLPTHWVHVEGDRYDCVPSELLPTTPPAKCHICGTETNKHRMICSAAGRPRHHAEPD